MRDRMIQQLEREDFARENKGRIKCVCLLTKEIKVLKLYLEHKMTYRQIAKDMAISQRTISKIIKKYFELYPSLKRYRKSVPG